jgi:hypothetical protein
LGRDPGETKNLSYQNPEKVKSMKLMYESWRAEMSDTIKGKNAK